jgi:MFS family permease
MKPRLRSRPLTWLFIAEAISLVGSRMSLLAVPWLVLETTGSAARTGLVVFAEMLPYVAASALGGPVVDQRGGRRMSIVADLASVAVVSLVPLLHWAELLTLPVLLPVMAAAGGLRGFGDIAKRAVFPLAVDRSEVDLTRATTMHDGIDRLSFLLGGALGGVLIGWLGAANVLLVDAASFGVAALLLAVRVQVPGAVATDQPAESYGTALRAGFAFVRQDRLILRIVLVVLVLNLLDQAHLGVFMPVWVHDVVGSPEALGLLFAAFGLGAVVGNLLFTVLAPKLPRYWAFTICFLVGGSPHMFVMAASDDVTTVAAVLLATGVMCAAINPVLSAVSYERIPRHLQARVLGLLRATAWAGIPIGGLLGGLVVEVLGLTGALLLTGTLYLAVTLVPLLSPIWRQIDRPPADRPSRRELNRSAAVPG